MNIFVHYPTNDGKVKTLQTKISKIYAEEVRRYINDLKCSKQEKLNIIKILERNTQIR